MAESTLKIILSAVDEGVQKTTGLASKALGGLGKAATGLAMGGAALAAGAIAGIGAASLSVATDLEEASASMQASLGLTAEEADKFGQIALNVFGNNFGDSIQGAGEAVTSVRQQLKLLADDELQSATENALRLTDTFEDGGADMEGVLNAVNTLMGEFGLSQQQAFDFVTEGFQRGLNSSGDFTDSISEYGILFGQAGADSGEFFSLLETGMAGGVLGTDKAADAFKEFQIKFLEGGDEISEAFGGLGLDYEEFIGAISAGEMTTSEAFQAVIDGLNEIEDPVEKNRIGVGLLGTQFEDMGADAIAALDLTKTSLAETEGATASLDTKYGTLASAMEGLKRQALVSLAPLGQIMLDGINAAMPAVKAGVTWFTEKGVPIIQQFAESAAQWIAEFAAKAQPIIEEFARQWRERVGPAMEIVKDALQRISEAFGGPQQEINTMDAGLAGLSGTLNSMITALEAVAVIMHGIAWSIEKVSEALRIASGLWDQMGQIVSLVGNKIPDWLKPGSPPPLFHALTDINKAITAMPDIGDALGFQGAMSPAPVGASLPMPASATANGATAIPPAGGNTTFNITIQASTAEGGQVAADAFVDQMRNRGVPIE